MEKLKKAEFLAGKSSKGTSILGDKKLLDRAEKELQTEFIPDLYDKTMDALFDDKYYQASDVGSEDMESQKDLDYQLLNDEVDKIGKGNDQPMVLGDDVDEKEFLKKQKAMKLKKYEENITKSLKQQVDQNEAAEGYDTWYACDECFQPIPGGSFRFDCQTCDNFSFCEKCYKKNTKHPHKFKRVKNSNDLQPPSNSEDLIAMSYMLCSVCKISLIDSSKRVYVCKECSGDVESGDIVYWCAKCKEETEHEHKRTKYKGLILEDDPDK